MMFLSVPSHIPQHHESGLTIQEHTNVTTAVSELAVPCCERKKRVSYVVYSAKGDARISKCAAVNGSRKCFKELPELS